MPTTCPAAPAIPTPPSRPSRPTICVAPAPGPGSHLPTHRTSAPVATRHTPLALPQHQATLPRKIKRYRFPDRRHRQVRIVELVQHQSRAGRTHVKTHHGAQECNVFDDTGQLVLVGKADALESPAVRGATSTLAPGCCPFSEATRNCCPATASTPAVGTTTWPSMVLSVPTNWATKVELGKL